MSKSHEMPWCHLCAEIDGSPQIARGEDAEGNPACPKHIGKRRLEFNEEFIERRLREHREYLRREAWREAEEAGL